MKEMNGSIHIDKENEEGEICKINDMLTKAFSFSENLGVSKEKQAVNVVCLGTNATETAVQLDCIRPVQLEGGSDVTPQLVMTPVNEYDQHVAKTTAVTPQLVTKITIANKSPLSSAFMYSK